MNTKPTNKHFIITALFAIWFTLHAVWFYYCHKYVLAGVMSLTVIAFWFWAGQIWREKRR